MHLEKIKVEKDDTILVHFDEDNCNPELIMDYLRCLEKLYPNNPIIPIIPIYGIEKFEIKSEKNIVQNRVMSANENLC